MTESAPEPVDLTSLLLAEPTPPAAGAYADLGDARLYYERYGSRDHEPLLLVHGGYGHAGFWFKQIPALATHYDLIVPDSRGHGRSSWPGGDISYHQMAEDMIALLDHLGLDSAHLVGWSDGGNIGLDLALHHPDRLRKVVAYGANYRTDGIRIDDTPSEIGDWYWRKSAADYERISPAPEKREEFNQATHRMWTTEPNFTDDQLRGLTTPFLVLDGENEEAILPEHTRALAALLPNAELNLMPDTGHFAPLDAPDRFNRIVLDYLAR